MQSPATKFVLNFSSLGHKFRLKFKISQNFELTRFYCIICQHACICLINMCLNGQTIKLGNISGGCYVTNYKLVWYLSFETQIIMILIFLLYKVMVQGLL
jgi:hypothetical protein